MKIAVLTPTFSYYSGIDRVVELETKELAKKGNEIVIYTFKGDLKTKAKVVELGMPKKPVLERLYRLLFFLDFIKVKKYAEEIKNFDMVISHFYPMNILAFKAKRANPKIKYVFKNYGVGITEAYSFSEKLYLKMFNWLQNRTIRNCDEAVSISDFLRKELEKETGIKGKVEYIKIDEKRFFPGLDREKIRRKLNMRGPMLLYVGRISPHKGIHLLIKAFNLVKKEMPTAKLVIVGKPTFKRYMKKLEKLAGDDVVFAGFVEDAELPYYYAASDLYATATLWEGYDMPACLPPKSKIKTKKGYKKIEEIEKGEFVLTHKNRFKRVSDEFKRKYKGKIIAISLFNNDKPSILTPEHKVFAIQTKKCNRTKTCKPTCPKKSIERCGRRYFENYTPRWVQAHELRKGDLVLLPFKKETRDLKYVKINDHVGGLEKERGCVYYKYSRKKEGNKKTYEEIGKRLNLSKNAVYRIVNKRFSELSKKTRRILNKHLTDIKYTPREKIRLPNKIRITKELMRLFGYYLSEGCATSTGVSVIFSFHSKEKEYHEDLMKLMRNIFNLEGTIEKKGNKCRIFYSSQILNRLLSSLLGKGAKNKRIPLYMINLPDKKLIELVKGMWYGDGTIHLSKKGQQSISYSTSSERLAYQLREILIRLGILPNINMNRKKGKIEYNIRVSGKDKKLFCRIFGIEYKENKHRNSHSLSWVEEGMIFSMIRKIKQAQYNGYVYNLEVKDDESYVTEHAAVHNCEAQACGKRVVAFDMGAHPEVVKNGVLVEKGNVEKFAEAVLKELV